MRFRDYYGDPETMLRTQILAQKWLLENVRTDAHAITGPWVGRGWVSDDADLRRLEAMDFVRSGVNARQIAYRKAMMASAGKYPVRFRGGEVFYPGENPALTHTSDGPFGVAGDLMGKTEIFLAVKERPDFVRELLRVVTDKLIEYLDFCWAEEGLPVPKDFAWTDDLAIDELQGFGYEVDLDRIGEVMGGKVVLLGNVNPMLIHSGKPEDVREATRRVIGKLGPRGGLIVQDGNNIPPGSPLANINAMMEAAEAWERG